MSEEFSQKTPISRLILIIILFIVLFALGIYVGFYMGVNSVSNELVVAEVQTNPITSTTATSSPINSPIDTSNWKTYTNDEYGFSIKYPSDWENIPEVKISSVGLVSSIASPEMIKARNDNSGMYRNDIEVYYFPKISDELNNKLNNWNAKSLDELIQNSNGKYTKVGEVNINGNKIYKITTSGILSSNFLFIEKNGQLYEIAINNIDSFDSIDKTLENIIDSFQFTK